jgi:chitinase
MANKHILKKTRRQAAVVVTGTGSATIDIFELATADQTVTAANLQLMISDIAYDVGNTANIKRDGNLIFAMNAGQNEFNFTDNIGVVLNEKANANVVVNLGAAEGTMIIQFTKGDGYNDPNRQNQGPGSL